MKVLQDKIAVITGAARGIGRAIAIELANAGAHVVVSDIDEDGVKNVASEIEDMGRRALAVRSDVSSVSDAGELLKKTIEVFQRIDILVNNAGITRDNLIMRMDDKEWDAVIAVNLKGTFNCIRAAARPMMKQRSGKIINLASVVGIIGNAGQANYAASKAGVIGLTKSVAKELGARNIQVNAVAPGYIETEMTEHLSQAAKESFLSIIPLKRTGKTEDVARLVRFLASSDADYISGQVINIDGGMVM